MTTSAHLSLWLVLSKLYAISMATGELEHPIPPNEYDFIVSFILKWFIIILLIEGTGLNKLHPVTKISISYGFKLFFFKISSTIP